MKNIIKWIYGSLVILLLVFVFVFISPATKPLAEVDNTQNEITDIEKNAAQGVNGLSLFFEDLSNLVGEQFEDLYLGRWLDYDDQSPYAALTNIEPAYEELARLHNVTLVLHKYSYKELFDLKEAIWEFDTLLYEGKIMGTGIDEINNVVEVEILRFDELLANNPDVAKQLEEDDRIIIINLEEEPEINFFATLKGGHTKYK